MVLKKNLKFTPFQAIVQLGSLLPFILLVYDYIFDRFFRCDPSRTSSGSGLGLSLVKAVAEAHHGVVEVSSTPGQGSLFEVTLPAGIDMSNN